MFKFDEKLISKARFYFYEVIECYPTVKDREIMTEKEREIWGEPHVFVRVFPIYGVNDYEVFYNNESLNEFIEEYEKRSHTFLYEEKNFNELLLKKANFYFYQVEICKGTEEEKKFYKQYCNERLQDYVKFYNRCLRNQVRVWRTSSEYEIADILYSNEELKKYIDDYEKELKDDNLDDLLYRR